MDPSFLFFLVLVLLGTIVTLHNFLTWRSGERRRPAKRRKVKPDFTPIAKGSIEDRRNV